MILNLINGKIWQGGLKNANLQICDGKIIKIGKNLPPADKEIDINGKIIFPGFIDCHVHFRDFEQNYKEDWQTGSQAAAIGGITTVLDMPNNQPPMLTINDLINKHKLASTKSVVNYGFHFGSSEENLEEIKALVYHQKMSALQERPSIDSGLPVALANSLLVSKLTSCVVSVKVYMNETTGKLKIDNHKVLQKIFNFCPLITAHAEANKVKEAVRLISKTPNKLYLCHISTKKEIEYLKKNKIKGKIFVEVTPHHLFLTNNDDKNSFTKMKPLLKSKTDQDALWQAVNKGLVDTISTDHAPHTIKDKKYDNPPFGVPGVETMMPLLFNAYHSGKISLEKIVKLCSSNPAKIFDLKNKGQIKVGFDADLTIVDLNLVKKIIATELRTKCGWSPFENWELKGWPVMTIVNGVIVFDKDQNFVSVGDKDKNNMTQ